ncbi:multidrug transporter AcrB [Bacterioplanes sanyensis]|uniref:efflux RND transporter permease subunit n=1 Tax=Bacterioplanes sanyensis TaxID=1249553 RepID=UPI001673A523|nr:efflux RND transporter permease subunit [Bacterioplanes sanyensis]GGY34499.1 multidrug transporter AcrB [Bacterioplanes sanyensis]
MAAENSATYFIRHATTSWMVLLILLIGGVISYLNLGRLEDPQFTIKEAMVVTFYPGASALQVEEEVTAPLENAIQSLAYIDYVDSISKAGSSQIHLVIKPEYQSEQLPQIWDELRRKIRDRQGSLPPGVKTPIIKDDFGDVFGVLLALTGDEYTYEDLSDYADFLKRELTTLEGIAKVEITGTQTEQVFIDISRERMTNLGIPISRLYGLLNTQNTVNSAGHIRIMDEYVRIYPTGEFQSVQELGNLLVSEPGSDKLIYLHDIARISEGVAEVPTHLTNYQAEPSLRIGVAFNSGVNVVEVGKHLRQRLADLEDNRPLGMELHTLYDQPAEVDKSSTGFVYNLLAAIVIVILVLLVFMGMRAGLIIGSILFLTVLGTFIVMETMGIQLHRISLGALIIALGMLVDNALVVTEGIMIGIQRGLSRREAAYQIVRQTQWPLLGATVIAITAFAPIGLSPDSTGEFVGSLFFVLLISLLLSWLTALSLTPFLCNLLFKDGQADNNADANETYKGLLYDVYRAILSRMLQHRMITMVSMVVAMIIAIVGFGQVKQSFFPPSNTPMFLVDIWLPEGTDIRATQQTARQLEQYFLKQPRVEFTSSTVGQGEQRFMLTYATEKQYPAYAQVMVRAEQREHIPALIDDARQWVADHIPGTFIKFKRLQIGPGSSAKIEARFSGPDQTVLRQLAEEATQILRDHDYAANIRYDWRQRVKVIRPAFNEDNARRAGISKQDLDDLLQLSVSGRTVGLYREGTTLKPIVIRPPEQERLNVDGLMDLQIWSPVFKRYIPIQQIVERFDVVFEDPIIARRDRKRTIEVYADPAANAPINANALFKQVRPQLEAIALPTGYQLEWGGEYESSRKAQASVFASLPLGYLIMFIITVLLFNEARSAIVIWSCVPLAIIGVTAGMLLLQAEFGFMALLGFLSLSGMIVKNGIVLVDQIRFELDNGKAGYDAIFEASVSRLRPVTMAALTTILGLLPLLADPFFSAMAVVICFGLGFATVLTLGVVPVMYSLTHGIKRA